MTRKLLLTIVFICCSLFYGNSQTSKRIKFVQTSDTTESISLPNESYADVFELLKAFVKSDISISFDYAKADMFNSMYNSHHNIDTLWIKKKKRNNIEGKNYKIELTTKKYKVRDSSYYKAYIGRVDASYTPLNQIKDKKFTLISVGEVYREQYGSQYIRDVRLKDEDGNGIIWKLNPYALPRVDICIYDVKATFAQNYIGHSFYKKELNIADVSRAKYTQLNCDQVDLTIRPINYSPKLDLILKDTNGLGYNASQLITQTAYESNIQKEEEEQKKYEAQDYYIPQIKEYAIGSKIFEYDRYEKPANNYISAAHIEYIKNKFVGKKFVLTNEIVDLLTKPHSSQRNIAYYPIDQFTGQKIKLSYGMEWVCKDLIVANKKVHREHMDAVADQKHKSLFFIFENSKGECIGASTPYERIKNEYADRYVLRCLPMFGSDMIYLDEYLVWKKEDDRKRAEAVRLQKEEERKKAEQRAEYLERSRKEQAERAKMLRLKYGDSDASLILSGKVRIGMTEQMCIEALGQPQRRNKTTNQYGTREQWVYYSQYLYFENGRLTTIQN